MSVRPRLAARVLAAVAVASLTGACGLIPKKVTKKDCDKWGEHFESSIKKYVEKQDGCDDKAAAKSVKETLKSNTDTVTEACAAYVDTLPYLSKDEECFMKGNGTKDWKSCNFGATTAFYMFNATAEGFEQAAQGVCSGMKGAKKGADDAADDDAPKKKSKKKAADDE